MEDSHIHSFSDAVFGSMTKLWRDRFVNNSPQDVLSSVFGYSEFRSLQAQAVQYIMEGHDVLVLMPTGGGKSICYQIPALCRPGLGLVISPLIALMDDQVASLQQHGINAAALHSELEQDVANKIQADLASGQLDILYVSPERLLSSSTLERLSKQNLSLIAIDEAHCISAWGHEFRPEYRALAALPQRFPSVPRIALTATADQRTRDDILNALDMPQAEILVSSFHRPNLTITVVPKISEREQLLNALTQHKEGACIVYCGSRARTERIAAALNTKGHVALAFHAGLSPMEKRAALLRFRSGERLIIVATIAFGMGIDRSDVRCVIHLDMPSSPEGYYQQIGRAGRDGKPSDTILLYGGSDIARARHWLDLSNAPEAEKKIMRSRLEAMIIFTETTTCRTASLLQCFGESLPAPCGHCDNCLHPVLTFNGTQAAQKILSAVYRTGQRYGITHIINVLRGKTTEATQRNAHENLSVWAIGKDHPESFWRSVSRQLIARGALRIDGDYNGLALEADVARPILRGEQVIELRADTMAELEGAAHAKRRKASNELPENANPEIFQALRLWRLHEAKEQEIPPYTIFHDATLHAIAAVHPNSLDELMQIKGVGPSKLDRYGAAILATIASGV